MQPLFTRLQGAIKQIIILGGRNGKFMEWHKKRLENDLLCPVLRGRIHYEITKYRKAHDQPGRVIVKVDDDVILDGNLFKYFKGYREVETAYKETHNIPRRQWNGKTIENQAVNEAAEMYIDRERLELGIFDVWQFTNAIELYLNQSIDKSLRSENPLVRLFAILDRRVGKRTLMNERAELEQLPDWLQFFYVLRFSAEGIRTDWRMNEPDKMS